VLEPRLAYSLSWLRLPYARAPVREVGGEQVRVHRGHVVPTWLGLGLGLWANPNPNPTLTLTLTLALTLTLSLALTPTQDP